MPRSPKRKRTEAGSKAAAEEIVRRNQLKILELEGKIRFHPDWDYKKLRKLNK